MATVTTISQGQQPQGPPQQHQQSQAQQRQSNANSFGRANQMIENRVFDYIYDKNYHVSTQYDHNQAAIKARSDGANIHVLPLYKTMFSELRHHPRVTIQLKPTLVLPGHVNQEWPGKQNFAREQALTQKLMTADHSKQIPDQLAKMQVTVDGQDRYKFSRRPVIPFLNVIPPHVVLDMNRHSQSQSQHSSQQNSQQQAEMDKIRDLNNAFTKTMATQTDYRDGEAQTDPYTPEYVVKPGTQPELLTLITLAHQRGLPVGLAEVEMIERARAKRAWESTLPPINDSSQWEKRLKMMTDMEKKEWLFREQEIEQIQALRMDMLKKMLKNREENQANILAKRLDRLWTRKQKEKESRVQRLRAENIKSIRKLIKKRGSHGDQKLQQQKRNIIQDYANYDTEVYAPMTRHGFFPDKNAESYQVKNKYLDTYQGLLELEASLPSYVLKMQVNNSQQPKRDTTTKDGYLKRKYREEKRLDDIHQNLTSQKDAQALKEAEEKKPLRFLKLIEKPIPRPPTPEIQIPSIRDEEKDLAVTYLQKIIRGKAIQNMMYEGKQEKLVLINEVASTHSLQHVDQAQAKQYKQRVLGLQRARHLNDQTSSMVDEVLQSLEGESVSDMLDFLSKELVRLQEERRIHAFAMLAERQRRMREAEESGLRQVEERRRREDDEIFKQMLKAEQECVDTYLEDAICEAMDQVADDEARDEIQEKANQINQVAYDIESKRSKTDSENIVADLVHDFLIPETQKQVYRDQLKNKQEPYLIAAHKALYSETNRVLMEQDKEEQHNNKQ